MGNVPAAPIQTRQAPRRVLTVFCNMSRAAAPPAGIFPAWVFAASGLMSVSEAPEAPRHLDVLPNAAIHPSEADPTQLKQTFSVCLS